MSFLVPYYLVYGSRVVDDDVSEDDAGEGPPVWFDGDTCFIGAKFEGTPAVAGIEPKKRRRGSKRRREVSFAPSADDRGYWDAIVSEIGATFGGELMPPEVGRRIVPDVAPDLRFLGKPTLYDCLMTDHW